MPQEACLLTAYGFRREHRAKPASEMEQSGIELGTAEMIKRESIGRSPRARWSKAESSWAKKVTHMSKQLKKSLVLQGSILAAAGLISKIIGFIYRVPMANIMGNTGNGLYSVSFGIYNIALTLSSYSMPLAVSRLMSARLAKKEYRNAHRLFMAALVFASISGLAAALILFFGADMLAVLYQKEGLQRPLRILAPTTFTVAILGTFRGYYQGHRNMVPTAVSQVIEQIINAIVSVLAAGQFAALCTQDSQKASYGAMGGTLGTFAGALSALILFLVLFLIDRRDRQEELKSDTGLTQEENKLLYKAIFFTVLPVILSQSIYQLGYTLDDLIFSHMMTLKGWHELKTTDIQGIFNTQYNQMINLPTAVATAMAAASMPSIVGSYTRKEKKTVRNKIDI
ncbi:MAG: polysaccharide biosynthesis protein, partial [Lachnospiraceae bacterium]|nr:polysaccharide biosynthesis protein [Lachnospiraceae bacterium]